MTGESFWIGKSREELSREAERRAAGMSATRIGASVQPRIVGLT